MSFYILCILQWLFLFYYATTPVTCSNNNTDFGALLAFKKAIDSDPLGSLNSWNETVQFCSWKGIFCSQRHQNRVVSINLTSQGLVGSLSPHFGNLSFLRSIALTNNTFYGQIPDEIGRLKRLQYVELSSNSFSGKIPKNLSRCTHVYHLNLHMNGLTGSINPELGSLRKLQRLGLGNNRLWGSIPSSFGNLTSLIIMSLLNCSLQGQIPDSLVQLSSLQVLNLNDNNLTGGVPSGIYNISTIVYLSMSSNHLEGTLPSELGFSSRFRYLDVRENRFHGVFPLSLSNFSMLDQIDLASNNFGGKINIDFSRISSLEYLILQYNNFYGDLSFISSLANCTRLSWLALSYNQFSGFLPDSIGNLSTELDSIYLGVNQLNGTIPFSIGNLEGLSLLTIGYNNLEGPIPSSIGKLNKLQVVSFTQNRLTGEIPFSFGNLTLLTFLRLEENDLYGNIPISVSNCTTLLNLNVSHNNLNGSIPREIMSLVTTSTFMDFSHNSFTGSIPLEVGSLIHLIYLDLSHNRLSGTIPTTLSSCIGLEQIRMETNSLNGEIPGGLRTLKGLEYLDLSQNNLTGNIPRFLGELGLEHLNLSFNMFQGEVPTLGVFLNKSAFSVEGNDELCGAIIYLNIRPCLSTSSKKKHFSTLLKILIPVVAGACISLLACLFYMFKYKHRVSKNDQSNVPLFDTSILRISYADLLKATGEFCMDNLLGAGRYGSVYRGTVNDGQNVLAVKVLNLDTKGASESFVSECNALRCIRHRNLVKLVSVCSTTDFQGNDFKALVYEFKANGNLDEWLHQKLEEERRNLSMRQRLNIAIDIASALEYLHSGTGSTIVHGDLKPSNILLDEEMTACVGDFGLAKIISSTFSAQESTSVGIKGTIGYIPPEYGTSAMISTQGDAYSYGILLLEMFTGRRPTDDVLMGYSSLLDLVRSFLPSQVMEIVDPVIVNELVQKTDTATWSCLVAVMEIGVACSKDLPRDRMAMSDVVNELYKVVHIVE